jgi:hypothetical protein
MTGNALPGMQCALQPAALLLHSIGHHKRSQTVIKYMDIACLSGIANDIHPTDHQSGNGPGLYVPPSPSEPLHAALGARKQARFRLIMVHLSVPFGRTHTFKLQKYVVPSF